MGAPGAGPSSRNEFASCNSKWAAQVLHFAVAASSSIGCNTVMGELLHCGALWCSVAFINVTSLSENLRVVVLTDAAGSIVVLVTATLRRHVYANRSGRTRLGMGTGPHDAARALPVREQRSGAQAAGATARPWHGALLAVPCGTCTI